ncbi:MAG: sugar ABC transporter permease [Devosia nanyangense]|uniref:Xylose transport system permease protein XylH n=1 Tax=Devosia nanyangense TaxID=1228055 RepID=A0A933NYE8_9HYPH|nr:sugar ABC transporter permease [Devosia nanyangense]
MADQQTVASVTRSEQRGGNPWQRFLAATELDVRLIGMIGALLIIWVGFHILSSPTYSLSTGLFMTPRNLWNLSVQTSEVAVMATGMVLIIVTRNIDLSVGSIVGFVGMVMGVLQAEILPDYLGFSHPAIWIIALLAGIALGALIGGLQGAIIAFLEVPAFIVTLGGYLVWRGAAWWVASGRTIAPMDQTFQLMGGGALGSIGALWSWVLCAVICVGIALVVLSGRRQRRRFNFPLRPVWAEALLTAIGCAIAIGAVWVANSYPWPKGVAQAWAKAHNVTIPPEGLFISTGVAIPVLIALGAGVVVTFMANRMRFGRYVYAIGGNPEAAELAGIRTKWVLVRVFMLMGALAGLSAAIGIARLNASTNGLGIQQELYVIAAAVIGGTSFAGGIGTIVGAMIGAVVMQSLQSGMVLIGIESPMQSIVVGTVLVFAVWLDSIYRRRAK